MLIFSIKMLYQEFSRYVRILCGQTTVIQIWNVINTNIKYLCLSVIGWNSNKLLSIQNDTSMVCSVRKLRHTKSTPISWAGILDLCMDGHETEFWLSFAASNCKYHKHNFYHYFLSFFFWKNLLLKYSFLKHNIKVLYHAMFATFDSKTMF